MRDRLAHCAAVQLQKGPVLICPNEFNTKSRINNSSYFSTK